MAIRSNAYLKSKFQNQDIPDQNDFGDMIDTLTQGQSGSTVLNNSFYAGVTLNDALSTVASMGGGTPVGVTGANVRAIAFTVPSLSANGRSVVQQDLGVLQNSSNALLSVYLSGGTFDNAISALQAGHFFPLAATKIAIGHSVTPSNSLKVPFVNDSLSDGNPSHAAFVRSNFLLLFNDYQQTRRFGDPNNTEFYGPSSNAQTFMQNNPNTIEYFGEFSYSTFKQLLNVPYLVGWYSQNIGAYGGATRYGCLDIDGFVSLESAWLSLSGGHSIANFSFYNESSASNSQSLALVLYE